MESAMYKNAGEEQRTKGQHKYTVYILYTVAAPGFWFEGETSEKISYMNFFQVLYCNDVANISVREGTFSKNLLIKDF